MIYNRYDIVLWVLFLASGMTKPLTSCRIFSCLIAEGHQPIILNKQYRCHPRYKVLYVSLHRLQVIRTYKDMLSVVT